MRRTLSLLFLVALFWIHPPGRLAGQDATADLRPVRAERFQAHAPPSAWIEHEAPGPNTIRADTVPADSSGSFPASVGLAAVGAVAGFYVGFSLPYGILYMPIAGAAYGAQLGDRLTGGVDPSLAGSLVGAALGGVAGLVPCVVGTFCQGPPFTILPGLAIGAALGVAVGYSRRAMSRAGPVPAPGLPPQPDPRSPVACDS